MRAVRVHEFGDPEVLLLEEVPQPEPVEGEVLVRIQAAGVNPFETYVRAGAYIDLPALPYTPGCDAAGRKPHFHRARRGRQQRSAHRHRLL